ncbi:MAG: cell division protein SepF [Clostridia bacterium]|nr:cell division protein SepF [Clostridia bacterium]
MSKLVDKLLGVIGVEVEEEEVMEERDVLPAERDGFIRNKKSNLVGLPTQRPTTVMLVKAKSFDEAESIARQIKERRSLIVNLEEADKEEAQRMVDFLSGTVFALDGTVQKVAFGTFLFATSNVDVVGRILEDEKETPISKLMPWTKK